MFLNLAAPAVEFCQTLHLKLSKMQNPHNKPILLTLSLSLNENKFSV